MGLHAYLLFVASSIVLVLVPGPDMAYLLARTLAQGRRAGILAALGINAGAYVHLAAAVVGLSALLLASATAFTIVRWAGGAYLVYLGVRTLMNQEAGSGPAVNDATARSLRQVFWQGFWSDVLNPKVVIFYVALLPQFVDPNAGHASLQLLLLGVTGNVVAICINLGLVAGAAGLTGRLRQDRRVASWLRRGMAALFIGLGVRLAAEKV